MTLKTKDADPKVGIQHPLFQPHLQLESLQVILHYLEYTLQSWP